MPTFIDHAGQVFGELRVIRLSEFKGNGKKPVTYWECFCSCGNDTVATGAALRAGATKSCGCGMAATQYIVKHNMSFSHEYKCWRGMKKRCSGKYIEYKSYADNGITVCDYWLNDFSNFYNDMGDAPTPKHTIDRIENDKGYYKENCRWASSKEQNLNYSQNRILTLDGKSMCVTQWADELGIDRFLIYNRLQQGWSVERALRTPKRA